MYVPAWLLPGNGYVTLICNGYVTTNISTARIDRGINIYPGNAWESASIHIHMCLSLTAIGLMPGDSVYKVHTINKERTHTSHENGTIHHTNFRSTITSRW
jgi:hypothetical protein